MPASLDHVHPGTPMGANLRAGGATFRVWGPRARAVHVLCDAAGLDPTDDNLLTKDDHDHWRGFVPGVQDRDLYLFHVVGAGSAGPKRDPYARELETPFPGRCVVRSGDFPWHDTGYVTPHFDDLVLYQLHVGVFFTPHLSGRAGTFLDVARKIPYLRDLGVTAVQLMPIQEFGTMSSKGYNGTDLFSPEMDFGVPDAALGPYRDDANALLDAKGLARYGPDDLRGEMNQLKALVDLCHAYGLAVILDVVFNHAGGDWDGGGRPVEKIEGIYDWDRRGGDKAHTPYFSTVGHAGGLVFDFARPEVRDFLIQNAKFFLDEYRVDGFRYDQVSVIDHDGRPHGWKFLQDLTGTLNHHRPRALDLAEYWDVNPYVVKRPPEGAGFDASLTDGLRNLIREVIAEARNPDDRPLPMARLGEAMWPGGFSHHAQFVQGPENHDLVYRDRLDRVARLGGEPRSWWATSRARVATGISLTAPGIPMLFMGQEFLEDKQWADDWKNHPGLLLHWAGLDAGDRQMADHLRFTRELIGLRWRHGGLRGNGCRVVHADDRDRVLAFHRWVPGVGDDVLVVVHLGVGHRYDYRIGFPGGGEWREVFNSDVYENWVNPHVAGNGGRVRADPSPLHGFDHSAGLVLPANSVLVFAR
ncbi:MAG: alpha amylase C-terminal domain-containing protein [Gemmataceae bacterium]|nr:alpha amylase C-terminal domain-containing protein [Gemmataceae bacterium]